jgi:hypothetical protein
MRAAMAFLGAPPSRNKHISWKLSKPCPAQAGLNLCMLFHQPCKYLRFQVWYYWEAVEISGSGAYLEEVDHWGYDFERYCAPGTGGKHLSS